MKTTIHTIENMFSHVRTKNGNKTKLQIITVDILSLREINTILVKEQSGYEKNLTF